jgi:hypothetical protein
VFGWLGLVAMASIIINGSYAAASYRISKVKWQKFRKAMLVKIYQCT